MSTPTVKSYDATTPVKEFDPRIAQKAEIGDRLDAGLSEILAPIDIGETGKRQEAAALFYNQQISTHAMTANSLKKRIEDRVTSFLHLQVLQIIITHAAADSLTGDQKNALLNGGDVTVSPLVRRKTGLTKIVVDAKGVPEVKKQLESDRAKLAQRSHEALATHYATVKDVHAAMRAHIQHLQVNPPSEPKHQEAVTAMHTLHQEITKTLAFDINASSKKDNATHKTEVEAHLAQVTTHISALQANQATHLASVTPGHPLHPLAQQHEHLVNALTAHRDLVQHHVDNHVMHVPTTP